MTLSSNFSITLITNGEGDIPFYFNKTLYLLRDGY